MGFQNVCANIVIIHFLHFLCCQKANLPLLYNYCKANPEPTAFVAMVDNKNWVVVAVYFSIFTTNRTLVVLRFHHAHVVVPAYVIFKL